MTHDLQQDVDLIGRIKAVPSILDVVCRSTGMGFAAVARVTKDHWVACEVLDNVDFGLKPGSELKVETTICHEIHHTLEEVVIDNVAENPIYCGHHTPAMYGLQSYISVPIVLADGTFFGTLCAIDPKPARLKGTHIVGMFRLFAELIASHVDAANKIADMERDLEERRENERRQRLLQRELAHRMKNTLAMVQAVVTQSLRNAGSLEEASHNATERIQALGRAQDMLTETNWETTDIRDVVTASLAPHLTDGSRFTIEGPAADLTAQQGMGLALAIHELATNATKYGALSSEVGQVTISWTIDEGRFRFGWREAGGPAVTPPSRKGFGSRLTERVVPSYFTGMASLAYPKHGAIYILDGSL